MRAFKRILLSLLATLPLGAISYAAEFESNVDVGRMKDVKTEFMRRLTAEELPDKYYLYMQKNNILSLEELNAAQNLEHFERMLKHFQLEQELGVFAISGSLSIAGAF